MKDIPGKQGVNTLGTGTDLTALPQRDVAPQIGEAQSYDQALKLRPIGKLRKLDTTPDVYNNEHWQTQNTVPVTITDFDNGQDGHHLYVLGDGQTTVAHNANIRNVAGVALLLAVGQAYEWVNINGVWYQSGSAVGGGGGGGAPTTAPYVTMALDPGLTAERVLVVVAGELDLVDGGPNANVTLGLPAVGTPGLYAGVTTDINGRVTSGYLLEEMSNILVHQVFGG